jgi:hypothetical protein
MPLFEFPQPVKMTLAAALSQPTRDHRAEKSESFLPKTGYLAVHPPSMRIVSPVIRDAALEARNTTAPATSIGSPMRCNAAMRSIVSEHTITLRKPNEMKRKRHNQAKTREVNQFWSVRRAQKVLIATRAFRSNAEEVEASPIR